MINFDGKELQEEFNLAFHNLYIVANPEAPILERTTRPITIQDLSLSQLWWLVKFAKHARGRCRNNSAFNNFMNRNFAPARFTEVSKEYNGKHYKGLKITVGNASSEGDDE